MNCAHVIGLIDAGPFADYPREHLDEAMRHAEQCARCGTALETATAMAADLAALDPPPPPNLEAQVLARIARLGDLPRAAETRAASRLRGVPSDTAWAGWVTALGAITAGLAIITSLDPDAFRAGITSVTFARLSTGLDTMPRTVSGSTFFLTGLVLYVVGLFASPHRRR